MYTLKHRQKEISLQDKHRQSQDVASAFHTGAIQRGKVFFHNSMNFTVVFTAQNTSGTVHRGQRSIRQRKDCICRCGKSAFCFVRIMRKKNQIFHNQSGIKKKMTSIKHCHLRIIHSFSAFPLHIRPLQRTKKHLICNQGHPAFLFEF